MAAPGEKTWILGAAVTGLVVVLVGWFMLIAPQRAETDEVEGRTADAQTFNLTLQGRINNLQTAAKDRAKYAAAMLAVRRALPTSADLSPFLFDVQATATATSTRVTTLQVGQPEPYTPIATAPAAATPTPAATDSASAGAASTGAEPADAAGPLSGVFGISIDASVVGRPAELSAFLTRLQTGQPRAVLVESVTRTSDGSGSAQLQLSMTAFVASVTSAASASSAPGGATTSGP